MVYTTVENPQLEDEVWMQNDDSYIKYVHYKSRSGDVCLIDRDVSEEFAYRIIPTTITDTSDYLSILEDCLFYKRWKR